MKIWIVHGRYEGDGGRYLTIDVIEPSELLDVTTRPRRPLSHGQP